MVGLKAINGIFLEEKEMGTLQDRKAGISECGKQKRGEKKTEKNRIRDTLCLYS